LFDNWKEQRHTVAKGAAIDEARFSAQGFESAHGGAQASAHLMFS